MFPNMRRHTQQLDPRTCEEILERNTAGVLALSAPDEYPYAVPLSYVWEPGHIFFHCALEGHKLDLIARNDRASFCIVDQDEVKPDEYTTYFRSVIAFGTVRVLDGAEKRRALELLGAKYTPDNPAGRLQEIEGAIERTCMLALDIEHLTGKQARELVKAQG